MIYWKSTFICQIYDMWRSLDVGEFKNICKSQFIPNEEDWTRQEIIVR